MNFNLDTDINNIAFDVYMEEQEYKTKETNVNELYSWYKEEPPQPVYNESQEKIL